MHNAQKIADHDEPDQPSKRRPVAFPIDPPPKSEEAVFVYSPIRGHWTIGLFANSKWYDRATGDEIERPTHWMPVPDWPTP